MAYLLGMTKNNAIKIFNGVPKLAAALGISRQAVYQWPDDLPQPLTDRVVGAALRLGINVPESSDEVPATQENGGV